MEQPPEPQSGQTGSDVKNEPRTDPNQGTYCLILRLEKERSIRVGRRPAWTFPQGYYVYVGSAMKNLSQRIKRHLGRKKRGKKLFWHIDFFLEHAVVLEVKTIRSGIRLECALSRRLAGQADVAAVPPRFGASDCRCRSHLHRFPKDPRPLLNNLWSEMNPRRALGLEAQECRFAPPEVRPLQNIGSRDEIEEGEDRSRRNITIFRGLRAEVRQ